MTIIKWIYAGLFLTVSFFTMAQSQSLNLSGTELEKIIETAAKKAAKEAVESALREQAKTNEQRPAGESLAKPSAVTRIFRIGSGSVGGNYFVLGELVGGVISQPKGSLPCEHGGTCGIAHLQSQNITSVGSVANLSALQNGSVQSGFVQSDIAYWAYTGTGLFTNKGKQEDIRAIASLYPEAIHIVVRKGANIQTVADLADKRVSVGSRESGTLHGARLILNAYKMDEDDIKPEYLNSTDSIKKLLNEELDAVFFTVGISSPILNELFNQSEQFTLLSVGDAQQQTIFKQGHYFSPFTIAANTYRNVGETKTVSVYALWLTAKDADETLVYELTKALWGDAAKQLIGSSLLGQHIHIDNSLKGIGIPLHPGAKKYYNEIGKRF